MAINAMAVVDALYAAWLHQDIDATLAYCSPTIFYRVFAPAGVQGFDIRAKGHDELREALQSTSRRWEFLSWEPRYYGTSGGILRVTLPFRSRHRKSGDVIEGTKRHHWLVADGLVERCDEYFDVRQMNAFLRMVKAEA